MCSMIRLVDIGVLGLLARKGQVTQRLFLTILVASALLLSGTSAAVERVDLFRASVTVSSESAKERESASQAAFVSMLIKISGDSNILATTPALKRYVNRASRYITSFHYRQRELDSRLSQRNNPPVLIKRSKELVLSFDEEGVMALLAETGARFWPSGRPEVLVWLAIEQNNDRNLVNPETEPAASAWLKQQATERGLPIITPELDLAERLRINAGDIWSFREPVIRSASRSYKADGLLVGRLSQTTSGWLGEWRFYSNNNQWVLPYRGGSAKEFFAQGVSRTTERLAREFSITAGGSEGSRVVTMEMSGLNQYVDYVAMRDYLDKLPGIKNIQVTHLDGVRCFLNFETTAALEQIESLLSLNPHFELNGRSSHNRMNYQWRS